MKTLFKVIKISTEFLSFGTTKYTSSFRLLTSIFIILQLLQTNLSQAQNLERYLVEAGEKNPELKAYFNDYLATMEQIPQVGALPDPELTVGFFLQPMERFMGNQLADIRLMQMFPWFGMLRTQKDEVGKMASARYEVFENAKNNLYYQVKSIYYEMYQLEEEIRITEENLKILQTYERIALSRFKSSGTGGSSSNMPSSGSMDSPTGTSSGSSMGGMSSGGNNARPSVKPAGSVVSDGGSMASGKSTMSDVLRIRIQLKELESNLLTLQDQKALLLTEFNKLLNREMEEAVILTDTLREATIPLDKIALLDSIRINNPMLKMLDAEAEAYEVQKEMARLNGRPMLGIGVNYMPFSARQENGMDMGGKDMIMPMVSVTIPIWRKKYNARHKEAEYNQLAVSQRKEDMVNQLEVEWSRAVRDLEDASRKIQLYKDQAKLAEQTVQLLMTSYSGSGQGFEEVLKVQQQLLDYQLKLVEAIVNQHMSIAQIEALM
ncbi:TolC family protein [Marivirga sp. S37H4]|uniref:TolC family protein n=1 Tax=Marivirga aurantiaca TaxID=2802615 RepID=A0A934WW95_9BACT|nr:TolC family protein [Marivirga aurantiaca]MBK6264097.1 TolC family protein [Marivirga aurantiaca]